MPKESDYGLRIIRDPKVYLVGRTEIAHSGLLAFLRDEGLSWSTDTEIGAEQIVEAAGRVCYMSFGKGRKSNAEYIGNLLAHRHGSVLEHVVWNFIITGVSRAFTHELVRHRAGTAFSQLSQRYVDESDAAFVEPDCIADDPELHSIWAGAVGHALGAYKVLVEMLSEKQNKSLPATLRRKIVRQAARSVLPNATETKIFFSANARALRHIIEMRANRHADVEIRKVFVEILRIMQTEAPSIFGDYTLIELEDGTFEAVTPNTKV